MITLFHYTDRRFARSIFESGLDTGIRPVAAHKNGKLRVGVRGCPWFTSAAPHGGLPVTDSMIVVQVEFPDVYPPLELWSRERYPDLPALYFNQNCDARIYVHNGTVAPDMLTSVRDLTGKEITRQDVRCEPIIRGASAVSEGAVLLDL
jgi:hypothetical protein